MEYKFKIYWFFILFLQFLSPATSFAQHHIKPGFNKVEYLDMLKLGERFSDKDHASNPNIPHGYRYVYISPEVGLKNKWELWQRDDSVAIISLRGTVSDNISWMENFYCGMVPANGSLQLGPSNIFQYRLSCYPNAYVHIGWLLGLAYLSGDILPRIDSLYHAGIKDFIIAGHSQGGALSFLVTSWMRQLIATNRLAKDIQIKTYSSAGPKPGNIYFAYGYENETREGWAYNVVNTADWVPETPISLQTLSDFNATNPFINAPEFIRKQPFPKNLVLKRVYNKMNRSSKEAVKTYDHYLGDMAGKIIRGYLKGYVQPKFVQNSYYVRAGYQITLQADSDYYQHFQDSKTNLFVHHEDDAYRYLINKYYPN